MDDENPEVIALIQSLHQGPDTRRRPRWLPFAVAAGVLLAGGSGMWWAFQRQVEPVQTPATPVDAAPAPELAPGPAATSPIVPDPPAPGDAPVSSTPRRGQTMRLVKPAPVPAPPVAPATDPASQTSAKLILKIDFWGDAILDGKKIGRIGVGSKVASSDIPYPVTPGPHDLIVTSKGSEEYKARIDVPAGPEPWTHIVRMKKIPTTVEIHKDMPPDCTLAIGSMSYGTLAQYGSYIINLTEPPERDKVVLACPGRPVYEEHLGKTNAGELRTIPVKMPWPP